MSLDESDLNELDFEILELLAERPISPTLGKRYLHDRGVREKISHQYVGQRLTRLAEHGHVVNLKDMGFYELVDDPRSTETIANGNPNVEIRDNGDIVWIGEAHYWVRCPLCSSEDVDERTDEADPDFDRQCRTCGLILPHASR